jgi:hypothetical protein
MPFYEGLLFNKKSGAIRSAIYLDKKIVNTKLEKNMFYIINSEIEKFKKETGIDCILRECPTLEH